jgi:uncharacterized protein
VAVFFYLFLAGLAGGFLAGLVGIGGGIVYIFVIPFALYFLGVPTELTAQLTIANSIFAILFASTSANYTLVKMKNFYPRPVVIIAASSVLASIATLKFVVNTTWYDVQKFTVVVILLLVYILILTIWNAKKGYQFPLSKISFLKYSLVGLASGVVASVSGLGGGIVIIPILNSLYKADIKESSSVSSGVIMITSLAMTSYNFTEDLPLWQYYNVGYILLPVGAALAAGVILSSPYGVKTAAKLSQKNISYIYATVLSIVIIKKITELL